MASPPGLLNRRDFLRTTAATTAATAAACLPAAVTAAAARRISVVDTHLHCFAGKDDSRFPYHARGPYQPDAAATPEHLLKCMDGAGVDFAVVVHPEPYQDDHRYLEHCLEVGGKRLKGTCLFFADRPGSVDRMPALVRRHRKRIVAARIHAFRPNRIPRFDSPGLKRLWKTASDIGLAIQLHFSPKHAAGFEPYIREFPKTTVIIDHLGRPLMGTSKEHAAVVRWARFKNTIMKVSSLPPADEKTPRPLKPIIRQLTDAYGAERMIYGGGFNGGATPASYRAYRQRVSELLAHLSADDQARILGGTAARVFGF